jgi:hypothetical protein
MMSISIISYPTFFILFVFESESGHKYENKYDISTSVRIRSVFIPTYGRGVLLRTVLAYCVLAQDDMAPKSDVAM